MCLQNQPACYFPLANGRYEVSAGFSLLGKNFGNGHIDHQIFQFDNTVEKYHRNKLACRHERLSKYYQQQNIHPDVEREVSTYLASQLYTEHPDKFNRTELDNGIELTCRLTGESLHFDINAKLLNATNTRSPVPYASSLDAIACQLQEDLAVIQLSETSEYLSALHLCSANHWAAEDKIGKSFLNIHSPVPHMNKINQRAKNLFKAVLEKGPYVRFAWGLATDTQLNHHPQPPPGITPIQWHGRRFNPAHPELWLRVERQTLTGFQNVNAILFTIRTYFYDICDLPDSNTKIEQLASAIQSMSRKTLVYKGLLHSKDDILIWLSSMHH